jgi:antitoxin component HigA of HigAB toxin-antitoxin module
MKTRTASSARSFKALPADYGELCRSVWLPRPIRDKADHAAALAAIHPFWGHETAMNQDQSDWFELVADLIADFEARTEKKAKPLPVTQRLAGLLEAHGMKAADLGRLLELEPSMGSKILHGTRQLTTAHIRKLAHHFAMPVGYFLDA